MRTYFSFLKSSFRPVYFGWLLTFFSSFGQTFLISIFVPSILSDFGFTKSLFGTYYSLATLVASIILLKVGDVIDHKPIRPFTIKTILLLSASCFLLAASVHPSMIFLALAGLRLGGQSLMPHISSSVISRHFDRDRGKALSFSSLGFSSGEIVFPVIMGFLISFAGWRISAAFSGIMLIGVLIPLLRKMDIEALDTNSEAKTASGTILKLQFFWKIAKRRNFWIIGSSSAFLSLSITAMFFYQYLLAEERGWPISWYALCFAGFGIFKLLFLMYGGILVDKLGVQKLLPVFLFPCITGFLILAFMTGKLSPLIFLPLIGTSVGLSGVIVAAAIADTYGIDRIGQTRSLFTFVMVISAAAGPVLYGILLDAGHSFESVAITSALIGILIATSNWLFKIYRQEDLPDSSRKNNQVF